MGTIFSRRLFKCLKIVLLSLVSSCDMEGLECKFRRFSFAVRLAANSSGHCSAQAYFIQARRFHMDCSLPCISLITGRRGGHVEIGSSDIEIKSHDLSITNGPTCLSKCCFSQARGSSLRGSAAPATNPCRDPGSVHNRTAVANVQDWANSGPTTLPQCSFPSKAYTQGTLMFSLFKLPHHRQGILVVQVDNSTCNPLWTCIHHPSRIAVKGLSNNLDIQTARLPCSSILLVNSSILSCSLPKARFLPDEGIRKYIGSRHGHQLFGAPWQRFARFGRLLS